MGDTAHVSAWSSESVNLVTCCNFFLVTTVPGLNLGVAARLPGISGDFAQMLLTVNTDWKSWRMVKQLLSSPQLENTRRDAYMFTPVNKLVITQILVFRPLWTFDKKRCLSVMFSMYQTLPERPERCCVQIHFIFLHAVVFIWWTGNTTSHKDYHSRYNSRNTSRTEPLTMSGFSRSYVVSSINCPSLLYVFTSGSWVVMLCFNISVCFLITQTRYSVLISVLNWYSPGDSWSLHRAG